MAPIRFLFVRLRREPRPERDEGLTRTVNLGYRKVHLPGHKKPYWLVISEVPALRKMWILLSKVPIERPSKPRRSGLTSAAVGELSRSSALSRKKAYTSRTSGSCPWKASVAWQTSSSWLPSSSSMGAMSSRQGLAHLAALVRKMGLNSEKDGPYLLLRGLCKIFACVATLALLKQEGLLDRLLELLDTL